jgi:hypothetical protein
MAVPAEGPAVTVSGTITGPATPGAPVWMCAATGGPLRPEALSFQATLVPLTVKLAVPDGDVPASSVGGGTSLRESSFAWNVSDAAIALAGSGCCCDVVAHAAMAKPTTTGKVRLILGPS